MKVRTRTPSRHGTRVSGALALLFVIPALGGCSSMNTTAGSTPTGSNGSPSGAPGTAVHDGRLTLDLRRPPTRADLGYPAGQNFVAYQSGFATSGGAPIDTTVVLASGTLRIPAYVVSADGGNPLAADDPDHLRPPVDVVLNRTFPSLAAAQQAIAADAAVLGISPAPHPTYQPDTDYSAVHDWLSVGVTIHTPAADGRVDVQYGFGFGLFHNPVRDKVVHDGVMSIDLTRLPSREDLAFQPTYSTSTVNPEPGKKLIVRLTLPGGVVQREVEGGVASYTDTDAAPDPRGVAEPRRTRFTTAGTSVEQLKAELLADAGALGLDPAAIEAGFAGTAGQDYGATLHGRGTAVYEVTVTFGGKLGTGNLNSATYSFVYRR